MRVAIAQARSPLLDLDASVATACRWIARAGGEGAELVAFGESFLGGYPLWVDWPGWPEWGSEASAELFARLGDAAIERDGTAVAAIAAACREAGVACVIGATERAGNGRSLFNALLFFDRAGELVLTRRKLVPTHGERLAWAPAPSADAAGLRSVELAGARTSGLICWEHWMPSARLALHRAGELVHVAVWPHGNELHQLASRHYAFEGACFVLCAAPYVTLDDLPELDLARPDDVVGLAGGSAIIAPDTSYVVAPVREREELLLADLDLRQAERAAFFLDTGGHYDRTDLD